jgi:hypothetical protein
MGYGFMVLHSLEEFGGLRHDIGTEGSGDEQNPTVPYHKLVTLHFGTALR